MTSFVFNALLLAALASASPARSMTSASATTSALNPAATDCFLTLPNDPLSATGLSTPFQLKAPCSMTVSTQQAYAEAAVFNPADGSIQIYHPLVIDAGKTPQVAPVVPNLPSNAQVALWFGFNGNVLQLLDVNGQDTNQSPTLKQIDCVNGLPGTQGDVFGQVSWCNTQPFFAAANASIAAGTTTIPALGTDKNGATCPSSRSFEIVDACPSDNVPTQYLLLSDGTTVQDTAANRAKFPDATVINNASDEALVANILDPLLGCTPFEGNSLDDPGATVPALALAELQAANKQQAPVALVPINDPDCLLTASGGTSDAKTNAYRLGVNQPLLGTGNTTATDGALIPYCTNMISTAPAFFQNNMAAFIGQTTPDDTVGNNLFTFMCNRYLMSLQQLNCPTSTTSKNPVTCALNGNAVATSCTINLSATAGGTSTSAVATATSTTHTGGKAGNSGNGGNGGKGGNQGASTASSSSVSGATSVSSTTAKTTSTNTGGKGGNNGNNGNRGNQGAFAASSSSSQLSTAAGTSATPAATTPAGFAGKAGGGGNRGEVEVSPLSISSSIVSAIAAANTTIASGGAVTGVMTAVATLQTQAQTPTTGGNAVAPLSSAGAQERFLFSGHQRRRHHVL